VDQRVLEGNAPSASEWSTALGVEFWAQHPPHTNPACIHPSRGLVRGLYGAEIFGIHNPKPQSTTVAYRSTEEKEERTIRINLSQSKKKEKKEDRKNQSSEEMHSPVTTKVVYYLDPSMSKELLYKARRSFNA
jgi:hypothetical protein